MFDKVKALINGKKKSPMVEGWTPRRGFHGGLLRFGDGAYDNVFADVSRIAEQFSTVLPYAIDASGKVLSPQPQVIHALYNPNREMSGPEFFEALAVMALVHPTVYILVHRKDGKRGTITPDNIGGFTFLEGVMPRLDDNYKVFYRVNNRVYSEDEVIRISLNINPYDVISGYSPTVAAKKWATLDDHIVDWQSGFFRNNAIPAGQFVITAKDPKEFNEIVDALEERHKGAGRNNNVTYVHRPVSSIDGKPVNAQIEWIPFAQTTKDLKLDQVFAQANKKVSMNYGVPEEVKGFVQNSNYASVTTAEHIFDKYTVYPKLQKIWAKFTQELNRITGGLGYAITFDYQITQLADENKVNAETTKIQLETLKTALDAGFDLKSAVDALELPEGFSRLKEKAKPAEENPEVINNGAANDISQVETSASKTIKVTRKKAPTAVDEEVEMLLEGYTEEQIEAAINGEDFDKEKESRSLAEKLLPILIAGAVIYALTRQRELEAAAISAGYEIDGDFKYEPTDGFQSSYLKYLYEITLSYSSDTEESIRRVLERAEVEELTDAERNNLLREILENDFYRIRRLSDTEAHRSSELASLDMAKEFKEEYQIEEMYKKWHLDPASLNHCGFCESLDGVELPLDASFEDYARENGLGEFSAGQAEVADAHPHCHCYITYIVPNLEIEEEKSVKLTCPKCKRYICEAKNGANLENVVCSRCKTHFNAKIINGGAHKEKR